LMIIIFEGGKEKHCWQIKTKKQKKNRALPQS